MTFSISESKKGYAETVRVMQQKSEQNFTKRLNDSQKMEEHIPKWFSPEGVMLEKTFLKG